MRQFRTSGFVRLSGFSPREPVKRRDLVADIESPLRSMRNNLNTRGIHSPRALREALYEPGEGRLAFADPLRKSSLSVRLVNGYSGQASSPAPTSMNWHDQKPAFASTLLSGYDGVGGQRRDPYSPFCARRVADVYGAGVLLSVSYKVSGFSSSRFLRVFVNFLFSEPTVQSFIKNGKLDYEFSFNRLCSF